MAHSLILGMTESGKTTCAVRLCHAYYGRGLSQIVLDPMADPRWLPPNYNDPERAIKRRTGESPEVFITSDPEIFLTTFWQSKGCMVFIDESGDMVGKYDQAMQKTATKGRHWGHCVHFLSQRGAQVNKTVRDQCSVLFLFSSGRKDAEIHAEEWNQPQLLDAPKLRRGEYFHVMRFDEKGNAGGLRKGALFDNEES